MNRTAREGGEELLFVVGFDLAIISYLDLLFEPKVPFMRRELRSQGEGSDDNYAALIRGP